MNKLISVRLLVDDFAAAFAFFKDRMEFPVQWGDAEGPYAEFAANEGLSIALFQREIMQGVLSDEAGDADADDRVTLIFGVDNVEETYELISGVTRPWIEPKDRPQWGVRTAHLRLPEGLLIEINRPLDTETS